ncbi:MAG: ammonium transporter, partial [candidate division NC10 bacterium]|nr:ammonium transporter [candidate division NC10 bacterium]
MLRRHTVWFAMLGALGFLAFAPWGALAQEAAKAPETVAFTKALADQLANSKVAADTMWTLVTAFLVFFMNAGFALVESGLCRAKNTVTILAKNFIVFAVSSVAFLILGFGLMFGDGTPFFGTQGLWFLVGPDASPATGDAYQGVYSALNWTGTPLWAKFFFQLVFAGTAATIVSGAVAERIKFSAFYLFSFLMVGVIYPIAGHWIWGGGWLAKLGMWDFAGSTVVHSVGGWAALAGALLLGARIGKYGKDGRVSPIPGHSITSATLGVFILWFGWFGFNPGSTMAADWSAIARIAATTNTAAAGAAISASLLAWWFLGKPDLTMILNGALAGLVAITAPCAFVSVPSSLIIGLAAGGLVVLSVLFFDKVKLDDPVGAVSVHLTCGVWGTLALGLFAQDQFMPGTTGNGLFFGGGWTLLLAQLTGVVGVGIFTFGISLLFWSLLKAAIGIRVSPEEEMEGLDVQEHGITAYPDFRIASVGEVGGGYSGAVPPLAMAAARAQ